MDHYGGLSGRSLIYTDDPEEVKVTKSYTVMKDTVVSLVRVTRDQCASGKMRHKNERNSLAARTSHLRHVTIAYFYKVSIYTEKNSVFSLFFSE